MFPCLKHETKVVAAQGRGEAIVNTSSIGGMVGAAGSAIYAASKWGLAGLTRCAALDYARQNIRVNAIAPGPTRSEMFDRWMADEARRERMASNTPMDYIAHPADMARAALYLLTDEARWTTGAILPCEGGLAADGARARTKTARNIRPGPSPSSACGVDQRREPVIESRNWNRLMKFR